MPKPRPLSPSEAARTLANRFGTRAGRPGLADRLRQLNTRFGLRSVRVFLVWTRWGGGRQGEGTERQIARLEVLPTPKVNDLDAVTWQPGHAGKHPDGNVSIEEVTLTLDRETLAGRKIPGRPTRQTPEGPVEIDAQDEAVEFFYELVDDGRDGTAGRRMRFRILGEPKRDEGMVMWRITLDRMSEDRAVDGTSDAWGDTS